MKKDLTDRRMLRTRALLHEALISLILKKGYDGITIQDIIDKANVGRSTFYAHYTGKEDLLRSGFTHLRELLLEQQKQALAKRGDPKARSLGFSLAMFEHALEHRELYMALVGQRGGTVVMQQLRKVLAELVHDDIAATLKITTPDAKKREVIVEFVVGAFITLLTWWLDHKAKISPAEIDSIFRELVLHGITRSQDLPQK
ncbi:MAG: TetR/AcrR family transcriptional regulator [Gammaproteobacteria bacterium]|nr:TetR/AcrR family transcriptional regulator [Gammaproteobacteria bacterium]